MECDVLLDGRRRSETEGKHRSPTVWFSLKRSLPCKSQPGEVHEPEDRSNPRSFLKSKLLMASLKNAIHVTYKRQIERPSSCSQRSIGTSCWGPAPKDRFGPNRLSSCTGAECIIPLPWMFSSRFDELSNPNLFGGRVHQGFSSISAFNGCHKCGERFGKFEGLEAHHLSKHAVTELEEGDSSRKVVEMICRTSSLKIERILKVHSTQKMLAGFEEHRNTIKLKAGKLQKKHPRCLADGNELLRFHGTAMSCNLGAGGSPGPCTSEKCGICRIIRHGFSTEGVFTASTSLAALKSVKIQVDDFAAKKALLICRVIAGRVHKPLENSHELGSGRSDFDSLAGKVGVYSGIEELYLLNPRALLPCFVVICKP